MKTVDARGLNCPQPVIESRKIVQDENPDSMMVIVDNDAARQNIEKFLVNSGYSATYEVKDGLFYVTGNRDENCKIMEESDLEGKASKHVFMITSDRIGHGNDTLGGNLMRNFILTLKELGPELWRIVFVNSGVKLAVTGSGSLDTLKELETAGVSILVCGTCLDFYDIIDHKEVGETTNMLDIVTSLQVADKVINL